MFELELLELFEDELFELFELELLDDNAGTGAGAGGGGGEGATVGGTVGPAVVGGSVVGGWVVGATVVVGGVVVVVIVVVVVDVELSMIGSGVPPWSSSARIVPVVTAAARPTAPIALARHAHRGGRVGRIVVLSLSSRAPSASVRSLTTMRSPR